MDFPQSTGNVRDDYENMICWVIAEVNGWTMDHAREVHKQQCQEYLARQKAEKDAQQTMEYGL